MSLYDDEELGATPTLVAGWSRGKTNKLSSNLEIPTN